MATTTHAPGTLDREEQRVERLRLTKQRTSKGIGLFSACLAAFGVTIGVVFWMASHVAPEPELSEGWVHEELDRPASAIGDPRTIGEPEAAAAARAEAEAEAAAEATDAQDEPGAAAARRTETDLAK